MFIYWRVPFVTYEYNNSPLIIRVWPKYTCLISLLCIIAFTEICLIISQWLSFDMSRLEMETSKTLCCLLQQSFVLAYVSVLSMQFFIFTCLRCLCFMLTMHMRYLYLILDTFVRRFVMFYIYNIIRWLSIWATFGYAFCLWRLITTKTVFTVVKTRNQNASLSRARRNC